MHPFFLKGLPHGGPYRSTTKKRMKNTGFALYTVRKSKSDVCPFAPLLSFPFSLYPLLLLSAARDAGSNNNHNNDNNKEWRYVNEMTREQILVYHSSTRTTKASVHFFLDLSFFIPSVDMRDDILLFCNWSCECGGRAWCVEEARSQTPICMLLSSLVLRYAHFVCHPFFFFCPTGSSLLIFFLPRGVVGKCLFLRFSDIIIMVQPCVFSFLPSFVTR